MNLFGICNEGSREKVTMISNERDRNEYNAVCLKLHFYFERIEPRASNAHELVLYMKSSSGQNKNKLLSDMLLCVC